MDISNLIVAFFIIIIVLTLLNMEPYHTGHLILPTPISIEVAVAIILFSLVVIIVILVPKRTYYPF